MQNPALLPLQGKRLSEIAALWHEDPIDALCDILIKDQAFTQTAVFGMDEADMLLALKQPWVSIDNDSSGAAPDGRLGEEQQLSLSDAIRKFSALPAQKLRLADRSVLKQGMWADIVVFDPATIRDKATFESPNQLSEGMDFVLVNGTPVIADGKMTGLLPGKVLRGQGYRK